MHLTKRKSLEELTLLDRFLFAETMEDPENLRILLDVYYGENVPLFRRNGYRKSGTMILRVRSRDTALK